MVGRIASGFRQSIDDVLRRRKVGIADGEGDDINTLRPLLGDLAADFGEEISGQFFDPLR